MKLIFALKNTILTPLKGGIHKANSLSLTPMPLKRGSRRANLFSLRIMLVKGRVSDDSPLLSSGESQQRLPKNDRRRERFIILALYVLLLAGGLWHVLNVFQTAMQVLAAPMIVGLCAVLCWEYLITQPDSLQVNEESSQAKRESRRTKFALWSLGVFGGGFLIELLGVKTGAIFGSYVYGQTLQPLLGNVPLVIGCAWLNMLLSSSALAQRILPQRLSAHALPLSFTVALLMVLFDAFMEPAAMKLGYWHWSAQKIPLRNFFAWLVFGVMLAYWGARWRIFPPRMTTIPLHAYFAQLGYFTMVNVS